MPACKLVFLGGGIKARGQARQAAADFIVWFLMNGFPQFLRGRHG